MHEFSISSEIVQNVLEAAEKSNAKKVLSIQLEIGEMTLISAEQVRFWVQELLKGSIAEGAEIRIKNVRVRIECESCNYKGRPLVDPKGGAGYLGPLSCPQCKSFEVKVKKGEGCILKHIRMAR